MTVTFWLDDQQWARLAPLLPDDARGVPLLGKALPFQEPHKIAHANLRLRKLNVWGSLFLTITMASLVAPYFVPGADRTLNEIDVFIFISFGLSIW